jgi:hypothetical protein
LSAAKPRTAAGRSGHEAAQAARRARSDPGSAAHESGVNRNYLSSVAPYGLLDIEQPLRDVTHTVEALRLVGHGLFIHYKAGGDAVAELARIAAERLQVVEATWNKVLAARQRQKS